MRKQSSVNVEELMMPNDKLLYTWWLKANGEGYKYFLTRLPRAATLWISRRRNLEVPWAICLGNLIPRVCFGLMVIERNTGWIIICSPIGAGVKDLMTQALGGLVVRFINFQFIWTNQIQRARFDQFITSSRRNVLILPLGITHWGHK